MPFICGIKSCILFAAHRCSIMVLLKAAATICTRMANQPEILNYFLYSIISDMSQSSIWQNLSIVFVLTLSFLFSLVSCDGLTLYSLISLYCDIFRCFITFHKLSNVIIKALLYKFSLHDNWYWSIFELPILVINLY